MKKLFYLILLISTTAFSQVDIVEEGWYRVFVNDSLVSKHDTKQEAIQEYINHKFKNTSNDVSIMFPDRVRLDFEGNLIESVQEIDTVNLKGFWLITGGHGNWFRHNNYKDISKIITSDTINKVDTIIRVVRVRNFGVTHYGLLR